MSNQVMYGRRDPLAGPALMFKKTVTAAEFNKRAHIYVEDVNDHTVNVYSIANRKIEYIDETVMVRPHIAWEQCQMWCPVADDPSSVVLLWGLPGAIYSDSKENLYLRGSLEYWCDQRAVEFNLLIFNRVKFAMDDTRVNDLTTVSVSPRTGEFPVGVRETETDVGFLLEFVLDPDLFRSLVNAERVGLLHKLNNMYRAARTSKVPNGGV